MWISDFAIRRPVITLVTMLAIVVFGLFSYFSLDTDEYPEVNPPVVSVAIPYPGASPDIVEREVVDPVEESISGLSGVDQINASALDGFALLVVMFDFEKDVQQATQDIRDAISQIRGDLPQEMEEPILTRFDPNDLPIISLTLSSATMTAAELTRIADPAITRQLRGVSGVAEVEVVGGVERELVVEIKPLALQAAGVSIAQVVQALQVQNLAVPVGSIRGDLVEHTIRLRGRLQGPADFQQIVVSQSGGRLVRLGEVADVRDGSEEPRTLALYNNEEAVGIDITKTTNSSTTAVSEAVLERVREIQGAIPAGATLRVVRDAGERVETSVANVREALLEGALLTVLVVFLFLNSWRSTVITGVALPISVLASFMAVWAFGFTLNTMSLLGLSLAIGILIDDAIVVRENIVRHVEMRKDHYTAAREGTAEIGLAVAATTFSIVVVFVPIGFMEGMAGQWFKPFALTIASSVLVSLFVSFSLDPMLSAYWPDPHKEEKDKSWITRKLDRFNAWFDRQAEGYKKVIGWALDHRWKMMALAAGSFFTALAMPALGIVGSSFFPVQDISEFNVVVEAPPGSNMDYTRLKIEEVVRIARSYDEVAYTYGTVGGQSGSVDEGTVYVRLVPKAQRDRLQYEIERDIRERLGSIGGATASISSGGFGGAKQIDVQLSGPDSRVLNDLARQIEGEVRQIPGAVDVGLSTKGQRPELDVQIERGLAASLGLSVAQVANSLRTAFAGIDAGDWVDPTGETRDVRVRLDPESRARARDLNSLPLTIAGPAGTATVPLGQVARVTQSVSPAQIDHLDGDRVISVQANTEGRPLSEVIAEIQTRVDNIDIPAGYTVRQGGETADQEEVFTSILAALGIAIMLMYLVLVVQFGSFLDPFAIMLSLPLSLIGVMLALLVTGSTVNLMSLIGVILLMGIVAKNAILLIDFAKWSEEEGMERREAIIEAGRVRLRPILMTTFALVAGMLPVAIGSGEGGDFRAPLGRAVIGGVLTSTLLTLLVIPTAYEILADWRDALFARVRGGRKAGGHEEGRGGIGGVHAVTEAGD
ncbi:MAG: efflux RND transporter permease subunit [Gemmatimonadetes bacterium]|nr:efflux RND transporter permease subunit [Gemmatimonadota bacterium]